MKKVFKMEYLEKTAIYRREIEDSDQYGKHVHICALFGEPKLLCEHGDCSTCMVPLFKRLEIIGAR